MSVSILLTQSNDLVVTNKGSIHQHDTGGYLEFIVPTTLPQGEIDANNTVVTLKMLNLGNELFEFTLSRDEDYNKDGYYKYTKGITSALSSIAGKIRLVLNIKRTNGALVVLNMNTNELILNVDKVDASFVAAKVEGGGETVVDLVVQGDKLILVNSNGEQVGNGVLTTSDSDDMLDSKRDSIIDLDEILGGANG